MHSSNWKAFDVCGKNGLFQIEFCKCDHAGALLDGEIPYVGAAKANNGVQKYVSDETQSLITEGNCIVFICNGQGSAGYALYQKERFIGTKDVKVGRNPHLNELNGLFIVAALDKNREIYGYGFAEKRSLDAMTREKVVLPSTADGEPDWEYMEQYMKSVMVNEMPYAEKIANIDTKKTPVDTVGWREFSVTDLFIVLKGRNKLSKADITDDGNVIVYSSESNNSGVFGLTNKCADYLISAEVPLYLVFGDHTRTMNIAQNDFCVMDNVKVLVPRFDGLMQLIFVAASWRKTIPSLGYARHWSVAKDSLIRLPVHPDGTPDWDYMANYMRGVLTDVRPSAEELSKLL